MDKVKVAAMLTAAEKKMPHVYDDSTGGPAVLASGGNITGGVGRNMSAVPFSEDEIALMLSNDIDRVHAALLAFAWYVSLDEVRQAGFINMAFNMGVAGLLHWPHLIAAASKLDYEQMHYEALDPHWMSQVHNRAEVVADMFLTGEWPS